MIHGVRRRQETPPESGAERIHGQAAPGVSLVLLSQERVGTAQFHGFSCTPCPDCFPWAELFLGQDSLDLCCSGELLGVPDQPEHKSCSGNVILGGRRSSSCAVQCQKAQILQSVPFQLRAKAGNYKHTRGRNAGPRSTQVQSSWG